MIAIGLIIHILGVLFLWIWDSFIGLGYTWNDFDHPPLLLVLVFWPISLPIIILLKFAEFLESARKNRIQKEKAKTKLRIQAQKELDHYLEEVEAELKQMNTFIRK